MKFRQYGYTEKKVEVREMTMGAIILTIAQGMVTKNKKDMEIRIVDCYSAEIDTYKNLDDLLSKNCVADWKVNVYSWGIMHNNSSDTDYLKVVISDDIEMME